VSGRGEAFKSGGRVVKNVTGYDLCKLIAGSWGTLAVLTDVTVKTLPRPQTEETVVIRGLEPARAIEAMTAATGSTGEISGASHLPAAVAARIPVDEVAAAGHALTAIRIEGFAPSVAHRKDMIRALLKPFGDVAMLGEMLSRSLWRAVRDVAPFAASRDDPERPLWRVSTAPSRGAELAGSLARQADAQMLFDWAGGLVWITLGACEDAGAGLIRRALAATGGHATLIRAPAAVRATVAVFEPQEAAVAALTKRIKQGFDPAGVLNPGRMWAGV
jgi:glycolate oxidase FAD binding subunit